MKKLLQLVVVLSICSASALAQTVTRSWVASSSVSIDGVGNYGSTQPSVSFTSSDFTSGCLVSDVDVVISWAKTAGTCQAPTGGASFHGETSFRINGPSNQAILALPGTWSGNVSTASVTTTFSDGNPIPSGTPITGTFGPNNGLLSVFNGVNPAGNWSLSAGDNAVGAPLCLNYYEVRVTTAADVTPPVINLPADITVNADPGSCTTTVSWTVVTATDNCSATLTQLSGPTNGGLFAAGVTPVTFQASDPYGNVTTQSFNVTVVDNQNPTITCPGTVFAGCNTTVNYPLPTATDNCSGVVVNLVSGPASGGVFVPGVTAVTYQAVDASGNTATCSFNVEVDLPSTAPTSITASSNTVCSGTPVTLTVNGGSLGTNAQWYWYIGGCGGQLVGAGASITVNPLSTANYFVRAVSGCSSTTCVSTLVTVTASPSVGFSGITSPSACGAADGTITAVAGGGTPPYTFIWSNGAVGPMINGLAAGPYQVLLADQNGCTDQSSVSINDPGASVVSITSSDPDNVICAGEYVTFTAVGAYQYQFYINGLPVSSQNPFVTNALVDGDIVSSTGTDFNFCTYTTQGITMTVHDNPIIAETVSDPSACATPDGQVTTSVSGGLPPYTYLWSNGDVNPNISGLPAGPYFVTVTDNRGCFTNGTYALSDPGAAPVTLASSEDPNNVICAGESMTFTASGSSTYVFFVNGQSVSTTNPYTTSTITNGQSIAATGTDGNNCTATSNIIYPVVNPGPIISLISNDVDNTICVGQSISFFASGGLTYEFFVNGVSQGPASSTAVFVGSSLVDGDIVTVIGTDANGCDVESAGITVTVNASPTVSISNTSDPTSCGASDGAITALASGGTPGYTYNWSNGLVGPTQAFLNAGSYFVTVTDDAGCTASTSASLSDIGSSPVFLASDATNNTICGGETVTFTGSGATTYVFYVNGIVASTNNPYLTDSLQQGDIIAVLGLDTQLCAATSAPVTYTVHPQIQIGVTSTISPSGCGLSDGQINTIVIGGVPTFTYAWSNGQTGPNALAVPAGAYSVTVTDANGCQAMDAASLSDPGSFAVSLVASPSNLTICAGTEITFTAGGGATSYEFFVDGISVGTTNPYISSALSNGQTVAVVGVDANNCTATSPGQTYQVLPVPSVTLTLPTSACSNGDPIQFSGGFPVGGEYSVEYGGIEIIGNLFFPELAGPGAIDVNYTYTALNGCSSTATGSYAVLQAPQVNLGNDTTVCSLTLDAGAGYVNYSWLPYNQTTQTIQASINGVYEVTVEDANGCIGMDQIGVTVNPIPSPTVTPPGIVEFCIGETITITAQAGYQSYSWSNGPTGPTTTVSSSDTITLTVTNQYGCEGEREVIAIMYEPQPGAVITWDGPLEFCIGGSVNLNAGAGYASYLWNSGSTTQSVNIIESGEYTVVVLDGNGCIDSSMVADPVVVTVWDPEPIIAVNGDVLTMTNASDFVGYQWFYNGNPIPGATSDSYDIVGSGTGTYMVCVVDDQGCEGCSFIYEMTCCVGIEEANFEGDVKVYPNPNDGNFTIEIGLNQSRNLSIGLHDMVGKQIWLDDAIGSTSQLRKQYDLSEMPNGVYFLRVFADNQMTVIKLIKQ